MLRQIAVRPKLWMIALLMGTACSGTPNKPAGSSTTGSPSATGATVGSTGSASTATTGSPSNASSNASSGASSNGASSNGAGSSGHASSGSAASNAGSGSNTGASSGAPTGSTSGSNGSNGATGSNSSGSTTSPTATSGSNGTGSTTASNSTGSSGTTVTGSTTANNGTNSSGTSVNNGTNSSGTSANNGTGSSGTSANNGTGSSGSNGTNASTSNGTTIGSNSTGSNGTNSSGTSANNGSGSSGTSANNGSGSSGTSANNGSGSSGTASSSGSTGSSVPAPTLNPLPPYTDQSSINVSGTAEAGALVTVTDGSTVKTQQLTAGQTSFSISLPLTANSDNTIDVTQTVGGSTSAAATESITQDNLAGSTIFLSPSDGGVINDQSPSSVTVVLSSVDNPGGSGVAEVNLEVDPYTDGGAQQTIAATSVDGGVWTAVWTPLTSTGTTYVLSGLSTDNAGNVEKADGTNSIDVTVANGVTLVAPTNLATAPASPTHDLSPVLSGDNSNATAVAIQITGGSATVTLPITEGAATFHSNVALTANSANVLSVVAMDAYGNVSPAATITVIEDDSAPTSAFTSPTNGAFIDIATGSPVVITGTCGDLADDSSINVSVREDAPTDGGQGGTSLPSSTTHTDGGCNWTASFTPATENGVQHTFTSTATSTDGLTQSPPTTITVTVATVAPAKPVGVAFNPANPTNDAVDLVSASVPCNVDSLTVLVLQEDAGFTGTGTPPGGCFAADGGTYAIAVNVNLTPVPGAATTYALNIFDTDPYGNASASVASSLTQDDISPALLAVTVDGDGGVEDDIPTTPGTTQPAFRNVTVGTTFTAQLDFNEQMNPSSFTASTLIILDSTPDAGLSGLPTSLPCSFPGALTATQVGNPQHSNCTPANPYSLAANHVYTLAFNPTSVKDASNPGNAFSTGAQTWDVYATQTGNPSVVGTSPTSASRNQPLNLTSFIVHYDRVMNADASSTTSVTNPANYQVLDCYLANPAAASSGPPTVPAGCTPMTVGTVKYNVLNSEVTISPTGGLNGLASPYHTYVVNVSPSGTPGVADLSGNPLLSPFSFQWTNLNVLPASTALAAKPYVDGGFGGALPDGGAEILAGNVGAEFVTAVLDPDNNPGAFWVDCASNSLYLSIWDGNSQFVNLLSSTSLPDCSSILNLTAAAAPGSTADASLFNLYSAISAKGTGAANPNAVVAILYSRPNRWSYTSEAPAVVVQSATQELIGALALNSKTLLTGAPTPEFAVASHASAGGVGAIAGRISEYKCTTLSCSAVGAAIKLTNTAGLGANPDTADASDQVTTLTALIDATGNMVVPYTAPEASTSSNPDATVFVARESTPGTAAPVGLAVSGASSSDISGVLWPTGPDGGVAQLPDGGENTNVAGDSFGLVFAYDGDVSGGTIVNSESLVGPVGSAGNAGLLRHINGTQTGEGKATIVGEGARVALTYDPVQQAWISVAAYRDNFTQFVYVQTSTDFVNWSPSANATAPGGQSPAVIDVNGANLSGNDPTADQGLFVYGATAGTLAGHWGDFYVDTTTAGVNVLVYAQQ